MIAFVFPGQGSQKVGMGRAFAEALPEAKRLFDEADAALGYSIAKLCFEGPDAELQMTANTQPAILTVSVAAHAAARARGIEAQVLAGHSLGEYSALVAAGALAFADAVKLVHLRGKFMQEAVPPGVGAMAAIVGLEARAVEDTCREALSGGSDEVCSPANLNGGGQTVIAGHRAAVERAMELAKKKGAKLVKALAVSAPFHCALMKPAAERLSAALETVKVSPLEIPVVSNVEARPNREAGRVKQLLVAQVTGSVRWEESVRALAEMGVTRAVELGAGRVLSGLIKRIAPEVQQASVEEPAQLEAVAG